MRCSRHIPIDSEQGQRTGTELVGADHDIGRFNGHVRGPAVGLDGLVGDDGGDLAPWMDSVSKFRRLSAVSHASPIAERGDCW